MNTKGPAATQYQYANTPICDPSECDDLKLNAKHRLLDQFGRYEKKKKDVPEKRSPSYDKDEVSNGRQRDGKQSNLYIIIVRMRSCTLALTPRTVHNSFNPNITFRTIPSMDNLVTSAAGVDIFLQI